MKKIYLMGIAILAGSFSYGQSNHERYTFGLMQKKTYSGLINQNVRPSAVSDDRALNILWTEDFSGTTALTTGNGVWTTSGPEGAYWQMSTGTSGPNGYALSMDGRHLLWDSYTPVTEASFASTPVEGTVISPTIDLSGATSSAASIEFDLNAMFCCNQEPWTFNISNDDGVTWGADIPLNLDLGANDNTNDLAEPVHFSIIISSYLDATAANNNDCKIRFTWTGLDPNGSGQYSTHYYWTIDNIQITEVPAYEIQNKKMWLSDVKSNYEVTSFPADQVSTLTVQSEVGNNGVNAPTGLTMEVTTFDATGTTIIDGPVSGGSLFAAPINSAEVDTFTFATTIDLSAYPIGEYKVRSVITHDNTDEVTANDTLWRTFKVTAASYGHVNYDFPEVNGFAAYTVDVDLGAAYEINSTVDLHGVDVNLLLSGGTIEPTTLGVPLEISIRNLTTDQFVGYFEYTLGNDNVGSWETFNFHQAEYSNISSPVTLTAGNEYAVMLSLSQGNTLWYNANLPDADYSGILLADDIYYWLGNEPFILLNFDQALNIENEVDNSFSIGQNVPNPFDNTSTISYTLEEGANVSVEFVDVSGKRVQTINQGNQAAGSYKINLNANDFAEGVYFYTFTIGEKQITKRMVVTK
ncbi:MAG: T9SS type A sorting domain-containing protein [Crocinitomicaceae bacterium]